MYLRSGNDQPINIEEINKRAPLFLAGHQGMLGTSLSNILKEYGYHNIISKTREELDLTDTKVVNEFFNKYRPLYVILTAALVGGIQANRTRPAEFIHNNLAIQDNVINAAGMFGVRKLVFFGSACMYPKDAEQPISEESLLMNIPEITSLPYAVAKIAGTIQCVAYRAQYGLNAITVVPATMYGPGDNFDFENGHVLSALLRKIYEAKHFRKDTVVVWGDGTPKREFLFVDDAANAVIQLLEKYNLSDPINIGSGQETTISELVDIICDVVGFRGRIVYDRSKPNGAPRKILDSTKIRTLGWKPKVSLREGIERTYQWYLSTL